MAAEGDVNAMFTDQYIEMLLQHVDMVTEMMVALLSRATLWQSSCIFICHCIRAAYCCTRVEIVPSILLYKKTTTTAMMIIRIVIITVMF